MSCMEQTRSKPTPRLLPQSFIKGLRTFNPRWLSFPPSQVCNLQFKGRPLCIIMLFCPQSGLGMGPAKALGGNCAQLPQEALCSEPPDFVADPAVESFACF